MTEPGSQVSSEGRNVPNLVLQEEERNGRVAIWHAHQIDKNCFDFFFILFFQRVEESESKEYQELSKITLESAFVELID